MDCCGLLLLLLTVYIIKVALSHFCWRTTVQCQMSRKSAMNSRHLCLWMCSTAV